MLCEMPGVFSGTEMLVIMSVRSVVDPGATCTMIEMLGDNAGAYVLLLQRL